MASPADERTKVVHDLAEAVAVIVLGVPALGPHVNDEAGREILRDLEEAAAKCAPLFDRLRKVI